MQNHDATWVTAVALVRLIEALEELRKKAVDRAILLAAERRKKVGIRNQNRVDMWNHGEYVYII